MSPRIVLPSALLALAACHGSPAHEPPAVAMPETWGDGSTTAASADPPERWWQEFHDPELDSLIERAVAANLDLAAARARVREARALRDETAGGQNPQVNAHAGYSRSQASANTRQGSVTGSEPRDFYDVGFDALWEIDVFGSTRHAVEAAEAGVEAAEEGRRDALVTLLGEVAREYVGLRGLQRQRSLIAANAEAQRQSLDLTRVRFQAGLSTDLDIARAQSLLSSTEAALPSLEAGASAGIHRLSVLLGVPPRTLEPELAPEAPVPHADETLSNLAAGVPADLLRRRPDIRRAEREFAQAAELSAEATADLYPKLFLGASLGFQSIHSGNLFEGDSKAWSIGPSLLAPIFDGGRLRAAVRVQDARQEQALAAYQQAVLVALEEVENALVALAREQERRTSLAEAVAASRRALDLGTDLNLRGLVDFFEVLDARRSNLLAEAALAESDAAVASGAVALYKALGGGWETLDRAGEPPAGGAGAGGAPAESDR
jgi:NodT family efflux transporter outer membrane factor (OMF) lipoprotein